MHVSISKPATLFKPEKARALADELGVDDDWVFTVEVFESGWAVIHIYDEVGEFVADYAN